MSEVVCQSVYLFKYPMSADSLIAVLLPRYCSVTLSHRYETQFILCYTYSKSFDNRHCWITSNNHWISIDESSISITLKRHFHIIMTLVSRHVPASEVLTYHISLCCKSWYKIIKWHTVANSNRTLNDLNYILPSPSSSVVTLVIKRITLVSPDIASATLVTIYCHLRLTALSD